MGGKGSNITKDLLRKLFQHTSWVGKPTHVSSSETLKKLRVSKLEKGIDVKIWQLIERGSPVTVPSSHLEAIL